MMSLKIIGLLLTYPGEDLKAALGDMRRALAGQMLPDGSRALDLAAPVIDHLEASDLMEAQETYVGLFDRSRSLALHLFEHVHGESRDRGQAMIDLKAMYEAEGLMLSERELPDYLPAFLEYLSLLDEPRARALLGEIEHIAQALAERLEKRESPYAGLFHILCRLADRPAARGAAPSQTELATTGDEATDSPEALDRAWREEPVTFTAAGACTHTGMRAQ